MGQELIDWAERSVSQRDRAPAGTLRFARAYMNFDRLATGNWYLATNHPCESPNSSKAPPSLVRA